MFHILGKCSLCGGAVAVPTVYHSVISPTPQCLSCGATKKNDLPVVEMEKKDDWAYLPNQLLNE